MATLGWKTTAEQALQGADLSKKTAVVTGGNSGLGAETVRVLALAGASVVLCSRSVEAGEKVAEEIRATGVKGKITVQQLDLAEFSSIKACAAALNQQLRDLDILVLNAGIMACPLTRTPHGFEQQFGVNHVGHFYLTQLLLPKLKLSGKQEDPARVVVLASLAHKFGAIDLEDLNYENRRYSAWPAYGQSKLANILFAKELARQLEAEKANVVTYSLHPGSILTNLPRHMGIFSNGLRLLSPLLNLFMKGVPEGTATTVFAATAAGIENGAYLSDCKVAKPSKAAGDMEVAAKLWEKTEALVNAVQV